MSTKTLRKRIALTAVAAMGLGLLSATSASAAAGTFTFTSSTSQGLLAGATQTDGSKANTATVLTTGSIDLSVTTSALPSVTKVVVSAGGYISTTNFETPTGDQASVKSSNGGARTLTVKPSGAAGSTFTIASYENDVLYQLTTVTIAASSVSGTVVAANSYVTWTANDGDAGIVDSATGAETTTGNKLNLNIQLNDAYKADVTSTTGALIVTASTGANVAISTDSGAVTTAGSYSTAVSAASPADINVIVSEATAGAGWSGTVSVTYNGVAIATKSGKITGNVASLVIAGSKIGKINSANANAITYVAKDAAGNTLAVSTASNIAFSSSSNTAVVSTLVGDAASTTTDAGKASFTCGIAGTSNIVAQYTVPSTGAVVKSNSLAVLCGDKADTFTLSLDKAKYAQGDVATATLTFKDSKGNLANSYESATSLNGAKDSISFPMAKQIGSITGAEVTDSKGQITFKFNVGDVSSFAAGKFNAVATFPTPANATAQTAAFEVTGSGGVSNSDILASIVKLITAINKQIAALQKLLLKK